MIGKDLGWLHFVCLTKLFPDLTNLLKIHSQGASQHQSEDMVMKIKLDNKGSYLDFSFNWPSFINRLS
jgi:hypothetical protein